MTPDPAATGEQSAQSVSVRTGTPLTPMQRSLWASQRRHPTSPLQNMALLTHLDGPIDPDRLADAFARVVSASDLLRTRVSSDDGGTTVRISEEVVPSEVLDVSRADAASWSLARVRDPIDLLQRGYDSAILRHEDGTLSWYLALHHAITDATSSMLVFEATAAAYAGEEIQLESYYRWWRQASRDVRRESAERFWQARRPAPKVGRLYRTVRRPDPASTRVPIALDDRLAGGIADRLAGDLAMISSDLAWTTLLTTVASTYFHRLTGADRFAIGVPVHNRSDAAARSVIGPLMEVFPVDVAIESGDTYRSLHRRIARSVMTTLRHARPGTAPAGADVEAVVNVIPRTGLGAFDGTPAHTTWIHAGASDPGHLFRLQLTSYGDGLDLVLDLNDAGADEGHRTRAPGHVGSLLRSLVEDPDRSIHHNTICEPDEVDALLRWGTGPDPGPPPTDVVAGLLTALHERDDVVLEQDGESWTGREIWARVCAVAAWLRDRGVGSGPHADRVGIEMARTADAVVAIFATLVAGGSYVPLDPAQPVERRRRLTERAGCTVVLSSLPDTAPVEPLTVAPPVAPDREAYLLYTSGSTGEPKGVPITRGGLARYLRFARSSYAVPAGTPMVAPLFSALTFDLTVTTLFVPLLAGGRLVVVPQDGPAGLAAMAHRRDLTWCKATPSHLELLLRLRPSWDLRSLIVGGEAFPGRLGRQLLEAFADVRVFNEYGPTEAVVGCMIHEATAETLADATDVPIGRPAPGVHLRVVDAGMQLAPIGATGELLISHEGVTTGYLRPGPEVDDAATGDDPFIGVEGRRWYRSGDVVRLTDPETLVYHGRVDEQIKVGGIRLEPTEIEDALTSHPAITRAAARVWTPSVTAASHHCVRCGLPSNVPGVGFDDDGVCDTCHAYGRIREQASAYFRTPDDLAAIREQARTERHGDYDCLHLLSGGKDSTYALYQLVEMGFRVYALTLDNGYISEGAKENVRRSVADLGIDHEFVSTDAMDEIFRDSLERHSNVCHGCYKTLYTLATSRADELGIPLIVTGLSRGQLFETRLIPQQFGADRFDPDAIDRAVVEARRSYHRADDAPNRLLDTTVFESGDVFDRISYVDFYRYVDVELAEMLSYLERSAPWVRPADTGRSTNCLINAAGIHNHLTEQGYHNYAIPYAWDVRLGHKTRQEAIDELDDDLDMPAVAEMLATVGHEPQPREVLTAWYELAGDATEPQPAELRAFLSGRLPSHAIPAAFVAVDEIPMTRNGKIDAEALPAPTRVHRPGPALHISAESPLEATIVAMYERILGLEPVGVTDDFFELGGDSLAALGLVLDLSEELGRTVREELVFANTTPRALAEAIDAQEDEVVETGVVPRPPGAPPELSAAEQAMLFEHLSEPDDPRYNVGHLFRVHGGLDVGHFVASVRAVIERHGPLTWTYGTPRRHLSADDAIDVFVRTGSVPAEDLASAVRRYHLQPFDLDEGPLGRCVVQPLDDDTTGVLLVFHHIAVDAGSFDRLWTQIDRAYGGADLELPAADYADHAAAQAERTRGVDLDPWMREPFADRVRFDEGTADGGGYLQRTASFTVEELRTGPGTTPFATTLAALAAVLRPRCAGDRVGIGLTVSMREGGTADDLVGLFLNTVPVGVDVAPGATFERVAEGANEAVAAALAARAVPLSTVVAARRRSALSELPVNVLLAFEDWAPTRLGTSSVDHEVLATGSPVADATFFVQVHGSRVELSIEHRNAALDPATAAQLLEELDQTIRAAIDRPRAPVGARQTAVAESSVVDGPTLESDARPLHALVSAQAQRDPEHPAVRIDDRVLAYGDLERRSNQLAHELRARGAAPGGFVGVSARRGPELIVAILGVLKSGAAYVPIDPDYPAERIRYVIADVGVTTIVTSSGVELDQHDATTVDPGSPALDRWPATAPDVAVGADDPAYVIHTSGSTGRPKGVVVRHRNIVASTQARSAVYPRDVERFLLLSSFAFDSSMVGIFWTLCTGGTLVFPPADAHDDVLRIDGLIERRRITHLLALPSLYRVMLSEAEDAQLRSLDTVIVAGEACPYDVVELHRQRCPDALLSNEYGPTEATVWSHASRIDDAVSGDPVPIGRPIPGAHHVVLDDSGRPVADGEPGELYLGGAGVTAGYIGRPDLTSERFVRLDPRIVGDRAGPWYRTGDLVRADGRAGLLYLGRVDDQVKIRGFRIEPGEVEAALRTLPEVSDAVVGAATVGGRAHLTAWYTPSEPASPPSVASLRQQLARRLPAQLVPSRFVSMAALPVGANGKVDRAALPAPDEAAEVEPRAPDAGPETGELGERGRLLASIWAEALGVDRVGSDDNFFDLGGDSIISLQIAARAHRVGIELRPRQLFEHQTVRELAAVADSTPTARPDQTPVVGPVPLTPIQHWFFERSFVEPDHWNQVLWLDLEPDVDIDRLVAALEHVRRSHDMLRASFRPTPDGWHQEVLDVAPPIPVHRSAGPDVEHGVSSTTGSLDLASGRVVALLVCADAADRPRRLLVAVHHLVIDGVSWAPILEDWSTAYRQLAAGEPVVLPDRTTSYRSWSEALIRTARSGTSVTPAQWTEAPQVSSQQAALRASTENIEAAARRVRATLDAAATDRLVHGGGPSAATVEELLLSACAVVLPRVLDGVGLSVLLEGHGREEVVDPDADVSRTVGWFTSQYPLTVALSAPADLARSLEETRTALRAIPDRGIGFGVHRALVADSPVAGWELPVVVVNYLGQLDRTLRVSTPFAAVGELRGDIAPANARPHLVGVVAWMTGGRLTVELDHLPTHLPDQDAKCLLDDLVATLTGLAGEGAHADPPAGVASHGLVSADELADLGRVLDALGDS